MPETPLKSNENALRGDTCLHPHTEPEKYIWVCPFCTRLHYHFEEECQCQGRLYPNRIDRGHISRSYVSDPL
jgi:hypothetical protein